MPVIPDDGLLGTTNVLMRWLSWPANNARVHLYENDYTPDRGTTVGNFVECAAAGLGGQLLGAAIFVGIDQYGRANWTFPQAVFTAIGPGLPQIAYGWWIDFLDVDGITTRVLECQRFQSPQGVAAAGQQIKFTASIGGAQC